VLGGGRRAAGIGAVTARPEAAPVSARGRAARAQNRRAGTASGSAPGGARPATGDVAALRGIVSAAAVPAVVTAPGGARPESATARCRHRARRRAAGGQRS